MQRKQQVSERVYTALPVGGLKGILHVHFEKESVKINLICVICSRDFHKTGLVNKNIKSEHRKNLLQHKCSILFACNLEAEKSNIDRSQNSWKSAYSECKCQLSLS